jgi:ELWxxDGT repeat protein
MGVLNGYLYFGSSDGINGLELWKSNGTGSGTILVKDIFLGSNDGLYYDPGLADSIGNTLYFGANDGKGFGLWKTDGTKDGTEIFERLLPPSLTYGSTPRLYNVSSKDKLVFRALYQDAAEVWISDGTPQGTQVLDTINPRPGGSDPYGLSRLGDFVYFEANDGLNGRELWRTDGTATGTTKVAEINKTPYSPGVYNISPSTGNADILDLTPSSNKLFFTADDGASGRELWVTEGADRTYMVKDLNAQGGSNPRYLTDFNGIVYFETNIGSIGSGIWRTDGTDSGTYMVESFATLGGGIGFGVLGDKLFFTAYSPFGAELWVTDGSIGGASVVKDINPALRPSNQGDYLIPESSFPTGFTAFDGKLYFAADDGLSGRELWETDGTQEGTRRVLDINDGPAGSDPTSFRVVGNTLFFTADDGVHGREPWAITNNIPPTNITASTDSFNENIPPGSQVAILSTSDPNAIESFSYALVGGDGDGDNGLFSISESQIVINATPDYEAKSSYSIRIRSTDSGGLSTEKVFGFSVNDLSESGGGGGNATPSTPNTASTPSQSITPTTPSTPSQPTTPQQPNDPSSSTDITGDDQSNRLEPNQTGQNRMTGKGGPDIFVQSVPESFNRRNADIITDFNGLERDSFELHRDAFTGLKRIMLKTVHSKKQFKKEQSKSSNLIYDIKKGELWYDANGRDKGFGQDGGIFMIIENNAPLTPGNFTIV